MMFFESKTKHLTNETVFILMTLLILLANYNQVVAKCIIQNDYMYVSFFKNKNILQTLFYGTDRWLPFGGFLNNFLLAYVLPFSASVARLLIIALGMVPVSLLFYIIYHRRFGMPAEPAFFAAVLPHIIPGQDLIPIFINGSYQTYVLIPSLLFFLMSASYLEEDGEVTSLMVVISILAAALFSTELSVFLLFPIFASLLLSFKKKKNFYILSFLCFLLTAGRLLIYHFGTKTIANDVHFANQFNSRFRQLIQSFYLIDKEFVFFSIVIYAILGVGVAIGAYLIIRHVFLKRDEAGGDDLKWLSIFLFAFTWMVFAGIPYVLLSGHPFSSRYGYPSSFGFSLLIVALPYYFAERKFFLRRILLVVFIAVTIVSIFGKLERTSKIYKPVEELTKRLATELSQIHFPQDSQILIAGNDLGLLRTASVLHWSSGFLRYFLRRDDLVGLIGPERSFYDPFRKWNYDFNRRMEGLSLEHPLFIYRYSAKDGTMTPIHYILQWQDGSAWKIFRVKNSLGQIFFYAEGQGKEEYFGKIKEMKSMGINAVDIFAGGLTSDYGQ